MRKQCRECRSTSNVEAPYCDACGCSFAGVSPLPDAQNKWQGRVISIVCGSVLLAAAVYQALNI